jgi:hypothetical protein
VNISRDVISENNVHNDQKYTLFWSPSVSHERTPTIIEEPNLLSETLDNVRVEHYLKVITPVFLNFKIAIFKFLRVNVHLNETYFFILGTSVARAS